MMRRAVASCRVTGVASNPLRSRAVASQLLRDQLRSALSTVRTRKIVAFPTSARFVSLRRSYAAQAGPQDVSEEEKEEIARRRQQGKAAAPKVSIQQRRIEELFQSANGCITEEKWTQAEDKMNTILDLQPTGTDTLFGRVLMNLAFVEHNLGKREKAAQHYGEGLAILKQTLGQDNEEVGRGLLNYAESLAFVAKIDQAEVASKEALPVFEKHYGPNHELVGALLSNLGGYLCAQSKLQEAQPIIKRALEILDRTLGRHNEFTTAVLTNYTRLLSDLGLNDQLEELKAKYSSNADTFLAFEALDKPDSNDPRVQAMVEEFKGLAQGRAFDPPGMFKSEAFHKEELRQFIKQWEAKHQGQLDPDLIPAVLEELEGIPREELDKMWADAAGELVASKRGREGAPSLDAIAESIDAEALEAEDGDEIDDEEGSESDETDSDEEGNEEDDDDEEDDEEVEKLGADEGQDEGDLWRATEANERKAAKNVEVDMSHVELRDDAPSPSSSKK